MYDLYAEWLGEEYFLSGNRQRLEEEDKVRPSHRWNARKPTAVATSLLGGVTGSRKMPHQETNRETHNYTHDFRGIRSRGIFLGSSNSPPETPKSKKEESHPFLSFSDVVFLYTTTTRGREKHQSLMFKEKKKKKRNCIDKSWNEWMFSALSWNAACQKPHETTRTEI